MATTIDLQPFTSLDIMSSTEPQFLKLEDVQNSSSASPAAPTPPPPVVIHSQKAKKRKSWGVALPEPVSHLPPRKRAKTADEKEQRRIERIKRNRAAAHNSRERKRQETETLAVALARANAELDAYRKLHGPLPASIILPEVTISTDDVPESESRDSEDRQPSPVDSVFKSSPRAIKQEPLDTSFPVTIPPSFDNIDDKSALSPMSLSLDPTQHSAAMLCDLQCRSSRNNLSFSSLTNSINSWWTRLFLFLTAFQIQTCYKTLLVALWTISPSRMARLLTQASTNLSTLRSTTSSTTPHPSRSSRRRLALTYETATGLRAPHGSGALTALPRRSVFEGSPSASSKVSRLELSTQQSRHSALRDDGDPTDRAKQNHGCDNTNQKDGVWHRRAT